MRVIRRVNGLVVSGWHAECKGKFACAIIDGEYSRYRWTEEQVQNRAEDEGGAVAVPEAATAPADPGNEAFVQTEEARAREEMGMLLVGFGTGLSVGLVFLVYVVLALAGLLH